MRRTILAVILGSLLLAAVSPAVAATGSATPAVHQGDPLTYLAGLWVKVLAHLGLVPSSPPQHRITPFCGGGGADPDGCPH